GPGGSGANVQMTDFCDPMMKLMPAEMSQVSTRIARAGRRLDRRTQRPVQARLLRRHDATYGPSFVRSHKPNRGCASPIELTQDRARHVKLPQKRWMRRQPSSTSWVLVREEIRNREP